MNCKCIETVQKKLMDRGTYERRTIENVLPPNMMWAFSEVGGETGQLSYEEFEVELEGLKKSKKVKISHTFCPWCGKHAGKLTDEVKAAYEGLNDLNS